MFPPSQGLRMDIDAISQICGSVSIACWIVVFSPQIIENWRRKSAEGLSVVFITTWLLGDFFNIFGAVLQGVLPTMIILAVYYTLADIVLLGQFFWYEGFRLTDKVVKADDEEDGIAGETSPLLREDDHEDNDRRRVNGFLAASNGHASPPPRISDIDRRHSSHSQTSSFRERFLSIDGTHLSPVTPLHRDTPSSIAGPSRPKPQSSTIQTVLFNLSTILLVCGAGVLGWYLSTTRVHHDSPPSHDKGKAPHHKADQEPLSFSPWGQVSGYICAVLYLGSRVPQLLLNYRRKSTEGISMLFFLFACIGNLTYVLSILAYEPVCGGSTRGLRLEGARSGRARCEAGEAWRLYGRYVAVNASWLAGSAGTLLLDAGVFVQYFLYRVEGPAEDAQ